MVYKLLMAAAPVLLGGAYMSGALGSATFEREVQRPQRDVMAALVDLDIRKQPGSPGTDASRAGGVTPEFRLERGEDNLRWVIMSGDQVAMTMTVEVEPTGDGSASRVVAHVDRGGAPDQFVSPAFRSEAVTLGLFSAAIQQELDNMNRRVGLGSELECAQLFARFESSNMAAGASSRPDSLGPAMAATASTVVRLNAYDAERRRLGCEEAGSNEPFTGMMERGPSESMAEADDEAMSEEHKSREEIEESGGWGNE